MNNVNLNLSIFNQHGFLQNETFGWPVGRAESFKLRKPPYKWLGNLLLVSIRKAKFFEKISEFPQKAELFSDLSFLESAQKKPVFMFS